MKVTFQPGWNRTLAISPAMGGKKKVLMMRIKVKRALRMPISIGSLATAHSDQAAST